MILTIFLDFSLMFISEYLKRRERDKYFCIISLNININRYQKYLIFNFLLIYFEMILFD